jgi:DNA repair photolyase
MLCTCPHKLTFNPYTGCDHECVYCYASSYIPKFSNCRPKRNLIQRLKKEATELKGEIVSISNSSDPYPNLEAEMGLMRNCLEILSRHSCRVQIVTKSTLVVRDFDLLRRMPSMVSLTITAADDATAKLIEPRAPPSSERLKTIETLVEKDIPTSVRIDPIIPCVNDDVEALIEALASSGVKHVTSSTYKVKPDNWRRFSKTMPKIAEKVRPLYFEKGEWISGYFYLPIDLRLKIMKTVRDSAGKYGMRFGTCRENLSSLNTGTCDGSWLLDEGPPKRS